MVHLLIKGLTRSTVAFADGITESWQNELDICKVECISANIGRHAEKAIISNCKMSVLCEGGSILKSEANE